jgi:hypothetical protein
MTVTKIRARTLVYLAVAFTVAFIGLLAVLYFEFAPVFRPLKLQLAGYEFIESENSFWASEREFFRNGFLSPDKQRIAVVSKISARSVDSGVIRISVFDLQSRQRLWKKDVDKGDNAEFAKIIWNSQGTQILLYNLSNYARVIDPSNGTEVRKFPTKTPCIFALENSVILFSSRYSLCSEKVSAMLISRNDFSVISEEPFKSVRENFGSYVVPKNSEFLEMQSPNKRFEVTQKDKFITVSSKELNKSWDITSHWRVDSFVWSKDSTILAVGGDNYSFTGVNGEKVAPSKNMLVLEWNGNGFSKRRLPTYGEAPSAAGFLNDSSTLIGLTDTSIIFWKL